MLVETLHNIIIHLNKYEYNKNEPELLSIKLRKVKRKPGISALPAHLIELNEVEYNGIVGTKASLLW